ncbi:MAG: DUF6198 family protein [Methanomassiliicoccales archaeon]
MGRKINIYGELSLMIGILLISLAVSLMVRADVGLSILASLPFALTTIFPDIAFGTWNIIFQISILAILLAITRKFKSRYLVSLIIATAFGYIAGFFMSALVGLPSDPWCRFVYFALGYLCCCFGISFMVASKVPLMINEAFLFDLSRHFHVTFRRMKTLFDISVVSLSILLPMIFLGHLAGVGIGTILMAMMTGAGVHETSRIISKIASIKPWSKMLGRMAE